MSLFKKLILVVSPLAIAPAVIFIIYLFSILKSFNDWINLLTLVVTLSILVTAVCAFNLARKSLQEATKVKIYQVLTDLIGRYRAAEMLLAIRTLWAFHDAIKEQLGYTQNEELTPLETLRLEKALWEEYNKRRKRDESEIRWLKPEGRLDREKTTLHHYRRIVGGFYELLAGIYKEEVIPPKTIFRYWNKETLAIIPKIILPIEKPLFRNLHPNKKVPRILDLMQTLYDNHTEDVNRNNVSPQN